MHRRCTCARPLCREPSRHVSCPCARGRRSLLAADENLQCTIDLKKAGMRPTRDRPSHGNTKNDDISDRSAYVLDEFGATAASVELQLVALSCADKTAKAAAASHRAAEAAWRAIRSAFDMQLSLLSIHAEHENMGKAFDEYESSIMVFDELVQQLKQDHVDMPLLWRLPIRTAPKIDGLLEGSLEEAETDDLGRLDIMAEMVLNDVEEPEFATLNSPPLKTASTTVWSISESSYQPAPAWTSVPWSGAQPPSVWNFDPNVSYHRAPGIVGHRSILLHTSARNTGQWQERRGMNRIPPTPACRTMLRVARPSRKSQILSTTQHIHSPQARTTRLM
ncbi:hypothetical protein BKA62DRAFT_50844 [Auriculariales sp. MPI-PUGE-AT-0066]|nr:hypothetical protein BKA62DRAFT_50844 [Auriculariales sp. MPI-PUGE-AT-0066]